MAVSKARAARRAGKTQSYTGCNIFRPKLDGLLLVETSYDPALVGVLDEPVYDDSRPVYGDYMYVVDGRVTRSDVFGTVRDLRRDEISQGRSATEVRRCDLVGRKERDLLQGWKM